jgi:hypothetical protein
MLLALANRLADSAGRRHALFLGAAIFTLVFTGYHFGTFDQTIHIPFLKKSVDPGLYPGDPFFDLRFEHYSYFWFFFRPFLRLGVLEEAMLAIHVLVTYMTFAALWTLSMTLFRSPLAALLSSLALMFPHIGFAGFPIIEFSLLNRTFALPFLLGATALYLRRQYLLAFGLLGLMYNVHVISTQFVLAMFVFDMVLRWRQVGLKRLGAGLGLFLAGASPVLAWKLGGSPVDFGLRPEWYSMVARGTLYNLFYLLPPYPHILVMTFSGASALLMFAIARRHSPAPDHDRTMTNFVLAGLIILAVQYFTARWLPITIIIQSQIIRVGVFLLIFGYLYFGAYLACRYADRRRDPSGYDTLAGAYASFTLPVAPVAVWALERAVGSPGLRRVLVWSALLLLFAGTMGIALAFGAWAPGVHPYGPQTAWEEAQVWARDNTARQAVFITPPHIWWLYQSDWRVFSERSTVVTLSDLLEIALVPGYFDTWHQRFEAVAPGAAGRFRGNYFENKEITAQAFYANSAADFIGLGQRFEAGFLVVERPHQYALPLLYENEAFRIYALEAEQ